MPLPDPSEAGDLDDLAGRLRALKVVAGDPSYESITTRVNEARPAIGRVGRSTVADCFRPGRRRLNAELVVAIVEALHPDPAYVDQWRQALRALGAETDAASQVRVQNNLPQDLAGLPAAPRNWDGWAARSTRPGRPARW